jgi:hypothetical protein
MARGEPPTRVTRWLPARCADGRPAVCRAVIDLASAEAVWTDWPDEWVTNANPAQVIGPRELTRGAAEIRAAAALGRPWPNG